MKFTVLSHAGLLVESFRSHAGDWVGLSGRARTVVYNTSAISEVDLPASLAGIADPRYKRRWGVAPTNGSFQAFVTAMLNAQYLSAAERQDLRLFHGVWEQDENENSP